MTLKTSERIPNEARWLCDMAFMDGYPKHEIQAYLDDRYPGMGAWIEATYGLVSHEMK